MHEELARVLPDGTYRLSPVSQSDHSLDTYDAGGLGGVQIYQANGNPPNQKWDLSWQGDGTFRLTPQSAGGRALDAFNENTPQAGVHAYNWLEW